MTDFENEYYDNLAADRDPDFDDYLPDYPDDEIGFNPYMGCYDFDC